MNKKRIIAVLGVIIFAVSVIIISQKDFVPRLINKLFPNTNEETSKSIKNEIGVIYGIDVSHHQGKIDWKKVKQWENKKICFVYVKATEGATYKDANYKQNFEGAKKNKFLVGSYHFFRTTSSVVEQFENFIKNVDKNKQDLIPLIDVEEIKNWNDTKFHKNFQEFLDLVENHFGEKPMIYTVNSFYNRHLSSKYKKYHILIGRYSENPPNMRDNSSWTIWQFSETGKVDGIPKYVDIDVINKKYSLEDLKLRNNDSTKSN